MGYTDPDDLTDVMGEWTEWFDPGERQDRRGN